MIMRKPQKKTNTIQDIFDCCEPDKDTGCLVWLYGRVGGKYGNVSYNGKFTLVHRLVYSFTHPDEDITDLFILHKCDNPPCCNPDHLFSGTHQDNMDDKRNKGRAIGGKLKGEEIGNSKLTMRAVEEIRHKYSQGGITHRELSEEYKVSRPNISLIIAGKIWKG